MTVTKADVEQYMNFEYIYILNEVGKRERRLSPGYPRCFEDVIKYMRGNGVEPSCRTCDYAYEGWHDKGLTCHLDEDERPLVDVNYVCRAFQVDRDLAVSQVTEIVREKQAATEELARINNKTCGKCLSPWKTIIEGDKLTGHIFCRTDNACHFVNDEIGSECGGYVPPDFVFSGEPLEESLFTDSLIDEVVVQGASGEIQGVIIKLPLINRQTLKNWELEKQPKKISEECWELFTAISNEDWDEVVNESYDVMQTVITQLFMVAEETDKDLAGMIKLGGLKHWKKCKERGLID